MRKKNTNSSKTNKDSTSDIKSLANDGKCIICNSPDIRVAWFDVFCFCHADNEDFTKRYYEAVLAPQLVDAEPNPLPPFMKKQASKSPINNNGDTGQDNQGSS